MTILELKKFLETLPLDFDAYTVSNGEYGRATEDEETFYYRLGKPVVTLFVDEESKELCILHQTREDIEQIRGGEETPENGEGPVDEQSSKDESK